MIIHTRSRGVQAKGQVHRIIRFVRSQQDGSAYFDCMLICALDGVDIMQTKARISLVFGELVELVRKWFDEMKHFVARLVFVESICGPLGDMTGQCVRPKMSTFS